MIGRLTGISPLFSGRKRLTNYDVQPLRKGDLAVISTQRRLPGQPESTVTADIVKIDAVEPHRGRRVNGHKVPWWGVRDDHDSVDYVRVTDASGQNPREYLFGTYVTQKGLAWRKLSQATIMHAKDDTGAPLRLTYGEDDSSQAHHRTGENMLQVVRANPREQVYIHRWEDYVTMHGKVAQWQAQQQKTASEAESGAKPQRSRLPEPSLN